MKLVSSNAKVSIDHLPATLDMALRSQIYNYLDEEKNTFSTLARDIDQYVRDQYKSSWELVESGMITEEQLLDHISSHCPKRTYLHNYAKGGAMCFRYTNSLANYFGISYRLSSFNPAQDLELSIRNS